MCLLALFFRAVDGAPLIVGANREEAYGRRGEPPQLLSGPVKAVGGRDPVAGGTWLGVNEHGVIVAVTNRPKTELPARPRSRGLLVRDLLHSTSAQAAAEAARDELGRGQYAGCNLLCADPSAAYVIHAGDWLRVLTLPPGLHVLTASDVNDLSDPRLAYARAWLAGRPYHDGEDCLEALKELCGQTGNGSPAICLHGAQGGTLSSSLIALKSQPTRGVYWHAQGPPDRTPYEDYSQFLQGFCWALLGS